MPFMDRDSFIQLLDSFGDPDDAKVLAAARTVHARMQEAGVGWDVLLVPPPPADLPDEDEPRGDGIDSDDDLPLDGPVTLDDDAPMADAGAESMNGKPGKAGRDLSGDDRTLIDRMLREYQLTAETRRELMDLRKDIEAGEFTPEDGKYVRALASRLSHRAPAR